MAINRHIEHIKSKVVNEGAPKLPEAADLHHGEIAINYAKGYETISIKNESGDVVTFKSDDYLINSRLSAVTADTHTHNNKSALDSITGNVGTMAYQNANNYSSATEVSNALVNVVKDASYVHTDNNFTTTLKDKLDGIAANAEVNVQSDWAETATTSDAFILNKPTLGTAAAKGVSNGITNSDNLIEAKHIYSGVGVTVAYDTDTHYIQLKSTSGNVLSSFDASAFIVDGMVENVEIKNVTSSGTCLVVSFNTDAGKQDINIPISQIFDASNYYTTGQTSGASEISTALAAKANTATTLAGYNISDAKIENGVITLGSNTITPLTSVTIPVTSVTTSSTNGAISVNGSDVDVHGLGGAAYLNTGTTVGTVADGGHTHSDYVGTATTITTASGLTGGGNLSTSRTIGLEATGTAGTYYRVVVDAYGRVTSGNSTDENTNYYTTGLTVSTATTSNTITVNGTNSVVTGSAVISAASTTAAGLMSSTDKSSLNTLSNLTGNTSVLSSITSTMVDQWNSGYTYIDVVVTGNTNNTTCPITLYNGQSVTVIYNNTSSSELTISIPNNSSQKTPEGADLTLKAKANGYAEANWIKVNNIVFVRGV